MLLVYLLYILLNFEYIYCTRMANSALKCRIIILITARLLWSYNNILINFRQLYSNSCYTTFCIATLGMCIACEFHQLWAVRPCIYHLFRHLTKWLILCRTGHACTVIYWTCQIVHKVLRFIWTTTLLSYNLWMSISRNHVGVTALNN